MKSLRHLFFALVLTIFAIPVMGEDPPIHLFSSDTIFAGQSNEVLILDPGWESGDQLGARLTRSEYIDWSLCPDCIVDTIRAEQVLKISDTVISATFNISMGTCPGTYYMDVFDEEYGKLGRKEFMYILSKPYVVSPPESLTLCYGEGATFEVTAYEPLDVLYQWYHQDELLDGETGNSLQLESVLMADTGWYYCVLKNQWGEDTTEAHLDIYPYTEEAGLPVGPVQLCMSSGLMNYYLPEDPLIDTYNWVLLPEEAGVVDMDERNATIQWNPDYAGKALLYAETGSGDCTGPNSDTLAIQVVGPLQTPEICIVGLDEASGKYRVVWNKLQDETIVAYNIFRESNQAGVFLKLKTFAVDEFSVYVDSSSSPESLSHSYKISFTDTCGNESDLSQVHSTVHLSANLGTGGENNLTWSQYEGFAFLSYKIYRGTHTDSLQAFQEVSSNVTSYSDLNPPEGKVYYQIVVSRNGECMPTKKSTTDYSIARSNVFEIFVIGIPDYANDNKFEIYPNPASDHLWIRSSHKQIDRILLQDLTGKVAVEQSVNSNEFRLNLGHLKPGLYILKVNTIKGEKTAKIIVE
ncbi:MAG: T9SS type A sorting domain-containing protein [Bacteroidales bacterium]|nr:T9SS type A sorting domain-containing protein [Bacteroidales bacterium]